ncbi:hypothetical protein WN51_04961 [Melipona quadrifasciata]|uniref:Uncharacterized protein n=1 Tax=Melipona quadrifasciata TaxID=166423 RepID=A0A0M8ZUC2_9HYME|nr:hypothetical protein WN51_04961 [Melipona quadrifasciata]
MDGVVGVALAVRKVGARVRGPPLSRLCDKLCNELTPLFRRDKATAKSRAITHRVQYHAVSYVTSRYRRVADTKNLRYDFLSSLFERTKSQNYKNYHGQRLGEKLAKDGDGNKVVKSGKSSDYRVGALSATSRN